MSIKEMVKYALRVIPDPLYLKLRYFLVFKKPLNLKNPQTFNEKLQWLKLYDRKPEYTRMVDKYEAKKYVAERIGEEYIIPTLGVWDHFDDIDFDALPDQFVLKCTHDSGGLVICKDKATLDMAAARKKIETCLNHNYYWDYREWPYKNVKPRVIAEKYMNDGTAQSGNQSEELTDYKYMCFNGTVSLIFTVTERYADSELKVSFFDKKWNRMPFERHYPASKEHIPKPHNLEKMIELSEKLAENIPFVRIDFYEADKQAYFGEITFFPGSGLEAFTPESWDGVLGSWLQLPSK